MELREKVAQQNDMKTTCYLITYAILFFGTYNKAETQTRIDTLQAQLDTLRQDSNRIGALLELGFWLRRNDPEEALNSAIEALQLSNKTQRPKDQIRSLLNMSDIYLDQGFYEKADSTIRLALSLSLSHGVEKGTADSYFNLSILRSEKGEYVASNDAALAGLEIYLRQNILKMVGASYENIGLNYLSLKNYDKAIENYKKSRHWFRESSEQRGISSSDLNIGGIFLEMGKLDSARYYFEHGLQIAIHTQAKRLEAWHLQALAEIAIEESKYNDAIRKLQDALTIQESMGDRHSQVGTFIQIAEALLQKNDFRRAEALLTKALALAQDIQSQPLIKDVYQSLANLYASMGQYQKAYGFQQQFVYMQDTLLQYENRKIVAEMEQRFQSEKQKKDLAIKDLELERNAAELKKKTYINQLLVAGLIGVFLLAILLAVVLRQRWIVLQLKSEREKENLLKKEKEAAIDAFMSGQELERKRIAEELHDGLGGTLASIKHSLILATESTVKKGKISDTIQEVDLACTELRNISHNLMPVDIEDLSFREWLTSFIDKQKSIQNTSILYHFYGDESSQALPNNIKLALIRILQELMYNIQKHAQANEINIMVTLMDDEINLLVEDDGVGFSQDQNVTGIGLKNIESRVQLLEGSFELDSQLGRGVIANITIPLTKKLIAS